jgi:hypothetical protein
MPSAMSRAAWITAVSCVIATTMRGQTSGSRRERITSVTLHPYDSIAAFTLKIFGAPARRSRVAAAVNAYDNRSFSADRDSLGMNYRGHDPYKLLMALRTKPVRDEYETTLQLEAREARWARSPLYGQVYYRDTIAIEDSFGLLESSYDADAGKMTFHLGASRGSAEDSDSPFLVVTSTNMSLPSVVGRTAMGARFRYSRTAFVQFGVKLANQSLARDSYTFEIRPEAARLKNLWRVLYVGNLDSSPTFRESDSHAPTLTEQYARELVTNGIALRVHEIWLLHVRTGVVFQRFSASR